MDVPLSVITDTVYVVVQIYGCETPVITDTVYVVVGIYRCETPCDH